MIKTMIILKHIIFNLSFFCFFMLSWQGLPQANTMFEASSSLKVASMFYKLSKATPNFTHWAKKSTAYIDAPHFDKDPVLKQQEIQLREVFYNTFTDQDLKIEIDMNLQNYSTIQEKMFLEEFSADTFFSYNLYGENYAIIVPNIEEYQQHEISNEEFMVFNDGKDQASSGIAELEVAPLSANNKRPLNIDGTDYWVMVGKINSLTVWNQDRTNILLSSRDEPMTTNEKLLDLYTK